MQSDAAQSFFLQPAANGFVTIVNTNSGKCLDVAGANPADGTVVQLYDCNGTNAQLWNPAVISGGGGGGGSPAAAAAAACAVHVANNCPVDVWIHGVGAEGTLQPDNAHLTPGASRDYNAPATWSAARIYAYLQAPDGAGNPQGQNDKVEMNFGVANGGEIINTDITYVDWVALPTQIQAIGSGTDCTTVGCEVPYNTCSTAVRRRCAPATSAWPPGSTVSIRRTTAIRCATRSTATSAACAASTPGCAGAAGATTAQVYSCSGGFFRQQPAILRGAQPRRPRPAGPEYAGERVLSEPAVQPVLGVGAPALPRHLRLPVRRLRRVESEQRPHLRRRDPAQHHLLPARLTQVSQNPLTAARDSRRARRTARRPPSCRG